jgi:hypothetical protein
VLSIEQMGVPNESRIGRAIGFAIILIVMFVVGEIWKPDNPVENQVGAQQDGIESGAQPATQPAPPASQPGGD